MEIARGCPDLEYLNLTWCVNVDDAAVTVVGQRCHRLKLISLYGLRGVTDVALDALAVTGRRTLTTLDVHGCCNVEILFYNCNFVLAFGDF
jgi:F-box/leucine-rich repeat protein 2/20